MSLHNSHSNSLFSSKLNGGGYWEWIDVAKVLTMILVIMGHATYLNINTPYEQFSVFDASLTQSPVYRFLHNIVTRFIYSFHMPLFMMLSGICFAISYKPEKNVSAIIRKKGRRLLLPFLLVTFLVSVPLKFFAGFYNESTYIFKDIIVGQFFLLGSSHLWFLVGLFIITAVFLITLRKGFNKNVIFYILAILLSFIGAATQGKTQFLGLTGALKNFVYFAIGFNFVKFFDTLQISKFTLILSWIMMFSCFFLLKYCPSLVKYPFRMIIEVWGCINMIALAKNIETLVKNLALYRLLKKHSYQLYLFSEPFNYLIILFIAYYFGEKTVSDNGISLFLYVLRVIGSLMGAYIIILFINNFIKPIFNKFNSATLSYPGK